MELTDLMNCIKNDTVPNMLILHGDEQAILNKYIDIMCKNYKKIEIQTAQQALNKINIKSLDKSPKAYIINEDVDFLKADKSWENVKKQLLNSKNKNRIILKYHKLDKRGKFYVTNKDISVEFNYLLNDVLINYIARDLPELNEDNAEKLIDYCNNDYGRILLEIDKIKQYRDYNRINTDAAFDELEKQDLFFKEIGDITFELTNSILNGYTQKSMIKLNEALQKGEPAIMVASILYKGFRNQLAYSSVGIDKKNVAEKTGLKKSEVYRCSQYAGAYTVNELVRNINICQFVESGIKTGKIDDSIALEYLVCKCLEV